jgi:putative hemolysin
MNAPQIDINKIKVRVTQDEAEVRAAQRLRYKIFYEEFAAIASEDIAREKRDFDQFDDAAEHLIVIDESIDDRDNNIVGTYRMLNQSAADKIGKFYSSDEYDLSALINRGTPLLELGRSCVLDTYRTKPVLKILWKGLADYMISRNIDTFFGCASLYGTDIDALSHQLSYLYHYHLAPENIRTKALAERYVDMNIIPKEELNVRAVFNELPPLIKGYLRAGAAIGDGAVIDPQFNTTDVCIIMSLSQIDEKYLKRYFPNYQDIITQRNVKDNNDDGQAALAGG